MTVASPPPSLRSTSQRFATAKSGPGEADIFKFKLMFKLQHHSLPGCGHSGKTTAKSGSLPGDTPPARDDVHQERQVRGGGQKRADSWRAVVQPSEQHAQQHERTQLLIMRIRPCRSNTVWDAGSFNAP